MVPAGTRVGRHKADDVTVDRLFNRMLHANDSAGPVDDFVRHVTSPGLPRSGERIAGLERESAVRCQATANGGKGSWYATVIDPPLRYVCGHDDEIDLTLPVN